MLLRPQLAAELGVNIPSPWVTWFKAAVVPALLGLAITPLIMYKVRRQRLLCMINWFPLRVVVSCVPPPHPLCTPPVAAEQNA